MKLGQFKDILTIGAPLDPAIAVLDVEQISADSRQVKAGCLFFALKGVQSDGVEYARAAVEAGAVGIVHDRSVVISDLAVPCFPVDDPREALALSAARFFPKQPDIVVAVTGTSGKTSVAAFLRQIFSIAGHDAAAIGTTGIDAPTSSFASKASLTTPDPVSLHRALNGLAQDGVTHCAMEASSHGLDQKRLDGVQLAAAGFTNLGRDHLDYHPDIDDYLRAKMRLFKEVLPEGAPAVIFADDIYSAHAIEAAESAGRLVRTVGRAGDFITVKRCEYRRNGQSVQIEFVGQNFDIQLPLAGDFQLSNALVAAGLAICSGISAQIVFKALEMLEGAPGRLEYIGATQTGAPVYVDYAHKPEALENVLGAVRPFTSGRIILVFGCGGDRDPGKRPIMGEIASRLADISIVTDDNPRSEDAASIRAEILAAVPQALEIGNRADAIQTATNMLQAGDTLIIAGKGHEEGQIVGIDVLPFSDKQQALYALEHVEARPLWTGEEMCAAMRGRPIGVLPENVSGLSIDTRTLQSGEAFFAIKGDRFDGHNFVSAAIKAKAGLIVVSESKLVSLGRVSVPMIVVEDVLIALEKLAMAARARSRAQIIAVTGSVGKTTTKDALRHVLSTQGNTHGAPASFNNHWGVPLTLARMPENTDYAVFEIGMNHPGEITPLVGMVKPHVAIITRIAEAHLGFFPSVEAIADAKAEIFTGIVDGGYAVLNHDDVQFDRLKNAAKRAHVDHIKTFGRDAQYQLNQFVPMDDGSTSELILNGKSYQLKMNVPGRHIVENMMAVLAAIDLVGGDVEQAVHALEGLSATKGRGAPIILTLPTGAAQLIDESYNANPTSMRAALSVLADRKPQGHGRRIAILGDMLELEDKSEGFHRELTKPIIQSNLDALFLIGPEMKALYTALEEVAPDLALYHAETRDGLVEILAQTIANDDIIMVKASNGIGLGQVVASLAEQFANLKA